MKQRIHPLETIALLLLILAFYGLAGSLEDDNTDSSNWLLTLTSSDGDSKSVLDLNKVTAYEE